MLKDILRHCIKEAKLFFISPLDYIHMRKFVSHMNGTARLLGMNNSKFDTASGASWAAYSTAHDLYLLTNAFKENDVLRSFCETRETVFNKKEIRNHALMEASACFNLPIAVKTGTYGSRNKAVCISSESLIFCVLTNDKTVFNDIFGTAKSIIGGSYINSDSIGYYGLVNGSIYDYNADKRFLPASTTKLLTALCAYRICGLDGTIVIKQIDIAGGSGSVYHPGDTFLISDAVKVMLMESSNTLANAIARTCGSMIDNR